MVKVNGRGVLFVAVLALIALAILAQAGRPSSAAGLTPTAPTPTETSTVEPSPTGPSPTPTATPEPPDNHLPLVVKQPTLTPTPTQTPTSTPTKTNTPTPQPTVITSAQFCRGPFLPIPTDATVTLLDTFSIGSSGSIVDLDVYINTAHTWVGDLRFSLTHDTVGTTRVLIDRPGYPGSGLGCMRNDISAILDDSASLAVEDQCADSVPTISGTFKPNEALSGFNNQNVNGSWTMRVEDVVSGDGGTFNGWCLFVDFTTTP